jgi:hypothetical protein
MEAINQALRRGIHTIVDSWPYNLLSAGFVYLFGGSEAIIGFVLLCVILDTLSKWVALTKKYLISIGHTEESIDLAALICGFLYAWKPDFITATALRKCWSDKFMAYGFLILMAGGIMKIPEISLFGLPVNKSICGGIYTGIMIAEISSVLRNLEEYGYKKLDYFKQLIATIVTRITGSNFSMTMTAANTMQTKPGGITPPPPLNTELPANIGKGGE